MLGTPNGSRVAARQAATRAEIIGAAWALAGEVGLAGITLRDIARRVGMQAPSLYTHFASKNAIYDAMYGQAWAAYEAAARAAADDLSDDPRTALRQIAQTFFDFAVADFPRYQLMNQRVIPGFEPSPESYAPAVRVLDEGVEIYRRYGVEDRADFDVWVALIGGLIDQQFANDPGGDRFARLLDRAFEIWADGVGLPPSPRKRAPR